MINWKEEFYKISKDYLGRVRELKDDVGYLEHSFTMYLEKLEREDLKERNKVKLMKLTCDCYITSIYNDCRSCPPIFYKQDTLIDCGKNGYIYLAGGNDGQINFNPLHLEEVELDKDSVNWEKVIRGG